MKQEFMEMAIRLSMKHTHRNASGPFGAVIVKGGKIVGRGFNRVTASNDPTAHAEIIAIRAACRKLKTFRLSGCEVYTSCEPCPMCLAAIYWARVRRVYFAATQGDAKRAGFDDELIYRELARPMTRRRIPMKQVLRREAVSALEAWRNSLSKITY